MFEVYVLSSVGGGPNFSKGVHILQENKFWVGSLFIEKLVPGRTDFGGSIFTMTGVGFKVPHDNCKDEKLRKRTNVFLAIVCILPHHVQ